MHSQAFPIVYQNIFHVCKMFPLFFVDKQIPILQIAGPSEGRMERVIDEVKSILKKEYDDSGNSCICCQQGESTNAKLIDLTLCGCKYCAICFEDMLLKQLQRCDSSTESVVQRQNSIGLFFNFQLEYLCIYFQFLKGL